MSILKQSDIMGLLKRVESIIKRHKKELAERYRLREIGVFGSYVRGEQKANSDIDIVVKFAEKDIPDLFKFIELQRHLKKLLRKKVDLVRKEAIRAEIKDAILKEVVYL